MGLVDSELCDNCTLKDTISHRFWQCTNIRSFWAHFEDWWNVLFPTEIIQMSEETVLFGFYLHQNRYTVNNCILQAKYFIHILPYSFAMGNTL